MTDPKVPVPDASTDDAATLFPGEDDFWGDASATDEDPADVTTTDDLLGTPAGQRSDDPTDEPGGSPPG